MNDRLRRFLRHLVCLVGLALVSGMVAVPAVGQIVLPGLHGGSVSEADLAQGRTVVIVWASWSPRGQDIVERINHIAVRWGDKARVIAINFQEDRQTVEAFVAAKSLRVPVYLDTDGAFSKKNAVTSLPGLLVFREGQTAFRGKLPDDPDAILHEILG